MFTLGQPAQEVAQELVAAFAEVFMLRGAHHGGDFRHGDAEFLLGEDSENIIRLQGEGDSQLFSTMLLLTRRSTASGGADSSLPRFA